MTLLVAVAAIMLFVVVVAAGSNGVVVGAGGVCVGKGDDVAAEIWMGATVRVVLFPRMASYSPAFFAGKREMVTFALVLSSFLKTRPTEPLEGSISVKAGVSQGSFKDGFLVEVALSPLTQEIFMLVPTAFSTTQEVFRVV